MLRMPEGLVAPAITLLLREAYEDPGVADRFSDDTYPRLTGPAVEGWVLNLLNDDARLGAYTPPRYYAERHERPFNGPQPPRETFSSAFVRTINVFQDQGYFPRALPRDCVDDPTNYDYVTRTIRSATRLHSVSWPISEPEASLLGEDVTFTLIEFFHDQAQRPRTFHTHAYAQCGPHFENHNRLAGGAVYRWRMNDMLVHHDVPLRLATEGPERGRLVHHFGSGLDALAEAQAKDAVPTVTAEAVRLYRERGASVPQKRSALTLLAGELERRRQTLKIVLKNDEGALFDIANNYAIRHQRDDYGPEYLDWVFWSFLAAVDLMNHLEARGTA